MDPAFPVGEVAEKAGLVLVGLSVAAMLITRSPTRRALSLALSLALAAVLLIGHIWNTEQFRSISGDAALFTVLLVAAAAAVAALAAAFRRRPALFPLLAVAALPFRVPIEAGGSTANLLVPLYLVVAGAAVASIWALLRVRDERERRIAPGRLERLLAVVVALYALQSLYSRDFETALEHTVFFYVPFALLLSLLAEVRWTRSLLIGCGAVLLGLALVFAGIGFWEYDRRELLWNPKVISANQFEPYFRVNSVFWDPNVYGRFLALVMVGVSAAMVWSTRPRTALTAAIVLAILWGGLVLTFSQSSIASLLIGLGVIAALRWNTQRAAAVSALALALGGLFVVAFQDALRLDLGSSSGLSRATSGRSDLIEGGADLFAQRPLLGHGSGAFARAFRVERKGNQQQAVSASHTLPITIAAEQGIVGLAAYVLLLVGAFRLLLGREGATGETARAPPSAADDDGARPATRGPEGGERTALLVARAALTAAFAALVAHTMMYAAFLEDPFTWVILAAALGLARQLREAPAPATVTAPAARPAAAAA